MHSVYLTWDFPGGPVVERLPANAGNMGSNPGLEGYHIPWDNWACKSQQQIPCSRACVLQLLKPVCPRAYALQQEKSWQ